jgi:pimeloyl-ACP methyl ester carboxylesterase
MPAAPRPDADNDEIPSVPGVGHRFVEVAGAAGPVVLHLAEAGAGDAVLMLHGWPQHWYCWRRVVPELSRRYRLLMPDLRGLGWSDAPGYGYDPLTFAADALALLDALGIGQVRLVGHDWGGFTAFLLGVAHPERFTRIVVFNAPPLWAPLTAKVIVSLWRTWYVTAIASPLGPRILASPRFLPWFLSLGARRRVFSAEDAQIYARRLQQPARARASCLLYRSYLRAAQDIFLRRRYHGDHLAVPTRLVFGDDDFYVPRSYIAGFEQHAPALDVEFVPGCGHFLPEERPDLASARLNDFLGA